MSGRSSAASSSSGSSSGGRSHYLLAPNYPVAEPVFYVPQVPNITRVPEPRPARRAPLAGYDMKTLRKQIEHLQSVSGLAASASFRSACRG